MRLPTWMVAVLLLTLIASCSAASTAGGSIVSNESSSDGPTEDDVRDLCRLLGSVATAQGVDLDEVFSGRDVVSECATAARGSSGS